MGGFQLGRIFDVALAIVGVAMATAILRPNSQAAPVIRASGDAFSEGVSAALRG